MAEENIYYAGNSPAETGCCAAARSSAGCVMSCFNKYACFSGRASRREFWLFNLFNLLVSSFILLSSVVCVSTGSGDPVFLWILCLFYWGAVILPVISVTVRRLHDTDRGGACISWALLPVIGWIILTVFLASPGTGGANRYGGRPR